jgi:hypothetical protein
MSQLSEHHQNKLKVEEIQHDLRILREKIFFDYQGKQEMVWMAKAFTDIDDMLNIIIARFLPVRDAEEWARELDRISVEMRYEEKWIGIEDTMAFNVEAMCRLLETFSIHKGEIKP